VFVCKIEVCNMAFYTEGDMASMPELLTVGEETNNSRKIRNIC